MKLETIKKRIEKDLVVTITVMTNQKPISLIGRCLDLVMHTPLYKDVRLPFEIIGGNKVRFNFKGMVNGIHSFTIYENKEQDTGATAVDAEKVIEIVPRSYMENDVKPEGLDVESVDLGFADMEVGAGNRTVTKEEIERVLTGDITSHNHNTQIVAILAQTLTNYVRKVVGKDLSTNDFTNALKEKLEGLQNYDDEAVLQAIQNINSRIDTLMGTSVSSAIDTFNEIEAFLAGISDTQSLTAMLNDLKNEITALIPTKTSQLKNDSNFSTKEELANALTGYVQKVIGKDLSSNDFTNVLKEKLEGLENYNDEAVQQSIQAINARIDTLVGGSASTAIDTFNEIETFLQGITDSQSLTAMLASLKSEIIALIPNVEGLATKEEVTEVENKIPTTTSQLQNNSNFVSDAHYQHTDCNYTQEEKDKLAGLQPGGGGSSPSVVVDQQLDAESQNAISNAAVTAGLANKVDAVKGRQLSEENYTSEDKQKLANLNEAQSSQIYDASALILEVLSSGANEGTITDVSQVTRVKEAIGANKLIVFSFPEESSLYTLECELIPLQLELKGRFRLLIGDYGNYPYSLDMYTFKENQTIKTPTNNPSFEDECYYDYGLRDTLNLSCVEEYDYAEEYKAEFISGETPTRLVYPTDWKWYGGTPVIKPNKRYFVHVIRYFAWLYEFDV